MPLGTRSWWVPIVALCSLALAAPTTGAEQAHISESPRIINGKPANGTFPEVGALLWRSGQIIEICTVTLIGCHTVLTAAHCFKHEDEYGVYVDLNPDHYRVFFPHAGIFNLTHGIECVDGCSIRTPLSRDVALVPLAEPVRGINPVAWSREDNIDYANEGVEGVIVGFGQSEDGPGSEGIKRSGSIKTSTCQGYLEEPANVDDYAICWQFVGSEGGTNVDNTCVGDSGGPLFVEVGGKTVQVGVTKNGDDLVEPYCQPPERSADASIYFHRSFVLKQLRQTEAFLSSNGSLQCPIVETWSAAIARTYDADEVISTTSIDAFPLWPGWLVTKDEECVDDRVEVKNGSLELSRSCDADDSLVLSSVGVAGLLNPIPLTPDTVLKFKEAGLLDAPPTDEFSHVNMDILACGAPNCGGLPAAGTPETTVATFSGEVSASGVSKSFSVVVPPGTRIVRFALNSDHLATFATDVYVAHSGIAGPDNNEGTIEKVASFKFVEFPNPSPGTWSVTVTGKAGSGNFQLTATTFQAPPTGTCRLLSYVLQRGSGFATPSSTEDLGFLLLSGSGGLYERRPYWDFFQTFDFFPDGYTIRGLTFESLADPEFGSTVEASWDDVSICNAPPPCGDADADDKITAGDALQVLRAAVDTQRSCRPQLCDMNGNGAISASDALSVLRIAVGQDVGSTCGRT